MSKILMKDRTCDYCNQPSTHRTKDVTGRWVLVCKRHVKEHCCSPLAKPIKLVSDTDKEQDDSLDLLMNIHYLMACNIPEEKGLNNEKGRAVAKKVIRRLVNQIDRLGDYIKEQNNKGE